VIFGGDGGVGRIRVEHCDTLTGTTNPPSSTQKLNCHIAEQIESAPYTQGRLNLPANVTGSATYKVQYGRKLNFATAGNQLTQLRLPAGLLSSVSLDALFSSMSSSAAYSIDVGDDGSVDWNGTAANAGAQTSTQLANAFNAYWSTHGAPSSGTIDVPLRVSLAGAGQVLLTNLQTQLSGSPLRFVRLNAESYNNVTINYTLAGAGNTAMTIAADVGDNGSIDWTTSANVALPYTANTDNLSSAINAWLAGKSGEQDVPVRFFVSPSSSSLTLNSFTATPATLPDPSIALADVSFSSNDVTEGDTVGMQITPRNTAGQPSKGFMASVFASPAGSSPVYIGSAFVPSLPANGSATVNVPFSTYGFTGTTPVRVMLDPTSRLSETNAGNNTVTATLAIVTRPDLVISNVLPSDAQPVVGQPVTITVNISNTGQRNAGTQTVSLYAGLPAAGNAPLSTQPLANLNGGSSAVMNFIWVPTATLTSQLVAVVDADNQINEFNEGNNTALLSLTAGFSGIRSADSGAAADDPAYAVGQGFGYIDIGQSDVMGECGSTPDKTFRRDPDGKVLYRFDHLQPGRFYHLDVVLYECNQGAGRQQYIKVDGATLAGPIDLGPDKANNVSLLLDPALYADRTISVSIEAGGGLGALVNSISLREVDYRYVDAGSANDAIYSASRGYGWLDNSTAVNASCGSLPSRTSRVDQNDNELRYRFDNLKPFKSYRVLFSFYQCTGTNVTQRIYIDDPPVGNDITMQANTLYTATRVVPASTYNTDGSIVVSIRRTDAGVGAMVSEIALEESTEKPTCSVQSTPATAQAYGVVRIDGNPAPAGTIVLAENPRGDTVGCFSVTTAGAYGFMPIYGEDAGASPPIGGMREGEIVLFRVNGSVAASTPRMTWTNSLSPVQINLDASYSPAQPIQLSPGWNFMSFRMQPPLPLVDVTLNSIRGKYCRVMGEAGLNYCTVPEQFRTMKEMQAGKGYYLHVTNTQSLNLLVDGVPLAANAPLPLHTGVNWVGYLPSSSLPVTVALQSIAGQYLRVAGISGFYDVSLPEFTTLWQLEPGKGYAIYATQPVTLTYPANGNGSLGNDGGQAIDAAAGEKPICSNVQVSPFYTVVYGEAKLSGSPMPRGTIVKAMTAEGRIAGCAVVGEAGRYGFMMVYGAGAGDEEAQGMKAGEPIRLQFGGMSAGDPPFTWSADQDIHRFDVDLTGYQINLPLVMKQE
jgi:hypothetical protein